MCSSGGRYSNNADGGFRAMKRGETEEEKMGEDWIGEKEEEEAQNYQIR